MPREEHVNDQYDRWLTGRTPTALYVRWYLRHARPRYARELFAALGDPAPCRLLDVGCAAGAYLAWAWDHGIGRELLAGVDISERLLADAERRLWPAREAGADVVLRRASATSLPFPDGSFDALLCNGVAKYLDDEMLDAFLAEAHRVLARGGRLAVADFGSVLRVQALVQPPQLLGVPTEHLRTAEELARALGRHGFDARPLELPRLKRLPFSYEGAVGALRT